MKQSKRARVWLILTAVLAVVIVGALIAVPRVLKSLYPVRYDEFVEIYAKDNDLEKSFVFAVIKCESSFDPRAVSHADARGLMQMLPETFEDLQARLGETLPVEDLFDPETSIRYGCYYYRYLMDQFGNDEALAVCAYHAGIGNVKKWLADPQYSKDGTSLDSIPFKETEKYLKRVMRAKKMYEKLYHF